MVRLVFKTTGQCSKLLLGKAPIVCALCNRPYGQNRAKRLKSMIMNYRINKLVEALSPLLRDCGGKTAAEYPVLCLFPDSSIAQVSADFHLQFMHGANVPQPLITHFTAGTYKTCFNVQRPVFFFPGRLKTVKQPIDGIHQCSYSNGSQISLCVVTKSVVLTARRYDDMIELLQLLLSMNGDPTQLEVTSSSTVMVLKKSKSY